MLVDRWPDSPLPPIFVVGPESWNFGNATLSGSSATRQRNKGGMCLVVCEGARVPDGQSVVGFERCGPEALLSSAGVRRLAEQPPDVSSAPGLPSILAAFNDQKLEVPPSARAIAAFLDAIADGEPPGLALPLIGGFRELGDVSELGPPRVVANLNLASGRSSAERLAPSSLAEIRSRASAVLGQAGATGAAGERIVELLLARDDAILSELSFDQAVAVLEQPPVAQLPAQVVHDLERYARENPDESEDALDARELAASLDDPLERKDAAQGLLELDAAHNEAIFGPTTRRRLKGQRRDRTIADGAIEAGLVRALDNLSSPLKSIELRDPPAHAEGSSESALKAIVTRAAVHVRLGPLLRELQARGVSVAAALLADPGPQLHGALVQLQGKGATALRLVRIAVRGTERGDTVEITWTPSAEDLVALVTATRFLTSESAALSLDAAGETGQLTLSGLGTRIAPAELSTVAAELRAVAATVLRDGYDSVALRRWVSAWTDAVAVAERDGQRGHHLDALAMAGCVHQDTDVAMTALSPLKSEWLASRTDAWMELTDLAYKVAAGENPRLQGDTFALPLRTTARALGDATAARYPAFIARAGRESPLLPSSDGSVFAAFGHGDFGAAFTPPPLEPVQVAIRKLIDLQPEAADHFRCAAWLPTACDLLAAALLEEMRRSKRLRRAEIYCLEGSPSSATLGALDDFARSQSEKTLQLRYVDDFAAWGGGDAPVVHLALLEGITHGPAQVNANLESVPVPPIDEDVLFSPRTWVRPNRSRVLLVPPRMSTASLAWHRLMTALVEDEWPASEGALLRVPELRADAASARLALHELHDRALWVATLDRYATRETIRQAAGDVAILHQERRVAGDAVFGLVISQRSGGTADRAIARSLKRSHLLDETVADTVARGLRRAASRGYGILALRAATTGSGINELIGHVAAFRRLISDATPWPLPPGCRVILISLDEYASWFGGGKRADLLALALSPEEHGVHAANIEVKAVKDPGSAARSALMEAKEQLRKTLIDSRFAAYPSGSLFSRLWLNRIVEAAVGVCRENDIRLSSDDLVALDSFRVGAGVLEWAGIAMVFTPGAAEPTQHSHLPLMGDRVPIVQSMVPLTRELLEEAAQSSGTQLRTVATGRPVLASSTKRRRGSDSEPPKLTGTPPSPVSVEVPEAEEAILGASDVDERRPPAPATDPSVSIEATDAARAHPSAGHPILGWDAVTAEPIEWRVTGSGALSNGHVEIYGTSGAGKTQFVMSLLTQLKGMGSNFGVCDFKNDYASDFPGRTGASFFDLWQSPLPFNPLAIEDPSRRNLQALTIELRDAVDIAARAYARLGHRQLTKLQQAFEEAFEQARLARRSAPTLSDVHELLDDDLRGVIGDLTGTDLFGDGPPLGSLIRQDAIFGLNRIPGTGMTTTLAAGFILASLYLKLLEMPQVANTVSYTLVIDEAHRVAHFHSVGSMVRELRSKGLAVILATQRPGDLPQEASTNAQTKIYLRLPDAGAAKDAGKALDPEDRGLPELVRTLPDGEAFVAFGGAAPRLIRLRQFWRDDSVSPG